MPYKDPQKRREYHQTNRELAKKRVREWRAANPEKQSEYHKKYREQHQAQRRVVTATAHARKIKAVPSFFGEFDKFVLHEAARLAVKREKITGFPWHVDHIIPFHGEKVSGLHVGLNLQVIPGSENRRKGKSFSVTC